MRLSHISPASRLRVAPSFLIAVVGLCASAGLAQAASPAWKLLAATGPTNLPPKQSEVQKVTVEADGGTFTLSTQAVRGEGALTAGLGFFDLTEASNEAVLVAGAVVPEPGMSASGSGLPAGTTVTSVEGTTVFLSNNAETTGLSRLTIASKEVTGVTTSVGAFHVGDAISGEGILPGTTVAAVGASTVTLSQAPSTGGTVALVGVERIGPVAYNASAPQLQGAFEALPAFSSGMFSVTGGPGGTAEHPYVVDFGGPVAEQNVEQLDSNDGGLVGEHAAAHVTTAVPGGPGTGEISINAANVGGGATAGEYTVEIGPLPAGIVTSNSAHGGGWTCPGGAGEHTLTCTSTTPVPPTSPANTVVIPIEVEPNIATSASVPIVVAGGGAGSASYQLPITVSAQSAPAGIAGFWAGSFDEDGNLAVQAGGHPYSAMTYFLLNTERSVGGKINPVGDSRDVVVNLPPGFLGDPLVTKRCPQSQPTLANYFGSSLCNEEMSVGTFSPALQEFGEAESGLATPFWNDVPAQGYAAQFTTKIAKPTQTLLGSLRSSEDFGVNILAPNDPNYDKVYGAFAVLKGFPAGAHGKAFLRNPTDCAQAAAQAPLETTKFDTWQSPGDFSADATEILPAITNCQPLTEAWAGKGPEPEKEEPSFSFQPSTTQGSSPTGATAHLHIPQEGLTDPNKLATSDMKKAVVTLPQGLSLNPSSASGLEACSESQIGYLGSGFSSPNPTRFNESAPSCPDGSKLGTFEISTPLLEEKLEGTIYLATQEENPFHSLIALYLVIESPRFGITVKLPGEVTPDPSTGQLTAAFDNNPQLPFEDLTLHFRGGGGRSELATPEVCGSYKTTGSLTPWSAEAGEAAQINDPGFTVSSGCASSPAARPFAPSFEAGTTSPVAGAYSPLVIKVNRNDGEQELTSLSFTLSEGLVGDLASVPYCSDAAIEAARTNSGKAEQANPSCPAASQIGTVDTAAGVGSEPFHVGGSAYLAGPYEGAPLSAVVITPAVAGPFDLGDVVVRAPLTIDPATAQVTAKSDPVPTILKGIPLKLRSVAITIDRPSFTLNPTSCEAMSITASLASSNGATATPSNRFQVGGCANLPFKPTLSASTQGNASKANGASLELKIAAKPGEANIHKVNLQLPVKLPSRNSTLQKACTDTQFNTNPAGCSAESIIGTATAHTPILQVPLTGPAYLVSHGGAAFPDIEFVLQAHERGGNIEIILDGHTQITKGITYSKFETVPDAPISSFETVLPEGPHSILTAYLPGSGNYNLCGQSLRMPTTLTGQNGVVLKQNTSIAVTGCAPSIRVIKQTVKGSVATLVVSVPSGGKLTANGAGLTFAAKTVSAAKSVTLRVKLNKREQAFLVRHPNRKARLRVELQFTAKSGPRLSSTAIVLIG